MQAWQWDGRAFCPVVSVPLTDRGFRYGMSVFESLAVRGSVVEFWEAHCQRLLTACIERDFPINEEAIREVEPLLREESAGGFARIYVTAGDGGPAASVEAPRVFVFIESRETVADDSWEIALHDEPIRTFAPGQKTGNYWPQIEMLSAARRRGFNEGLVFNDHAELVSAACANVFLVRDDRILTPSRGSGCRNGVVREWVVKRRKVEERRLRREEIVSADEIFLTNSWMGVMPVDSVEGRPLGPRRVGPKLRGEWQQQFAGTR